MKRVLNGSLTAVYALAIVYPAASRVSNASWTQRRLVDQLATDCWNRPVPFRMSLLIDVLNGSSI